MPCVVSFANDTAAHYVATGHSLLAPANSRTCSAASKQTYHRLSQPH